MDDIFRPSTYNPSMNASNDDLAVIYLTPPVVKTANVDALLPSKDDKEDFYVNEALVVCGFGVIDNLRNISKTLKCTTMKVVPSADCIAATIDPKPVSTNKICMRNNNYQNACKDDFGGPVYQNKTGVLTPVGIISYFPNARYNARCQDGHMVVATQLGGYQTFLTNPRAP